MKLKLLLAAAMMTIATAVSVSAMDNVSGMNGMVEITDTTTTIDQTSMLAVSVNDTITINVTGVNGSLTLLSYKKGQEPSPDNIQYIRQYTPVGGVVNVTFQIRSIVPENETAQENGLYYVKLNDGNGSVRTLCYKVGKPVSEKGEYNGVKVEYNQRVDFTKDGYTGAGAGTISVAYKASFTSNGGSVNEYGFKVSYKTGETDSNNNEIINSVTEKISLDNTTINGDFSFGITVFDIPDEAEIANISATPFVNYNVENKVIATN